MPRKKNSQLNINPYRERFSSFVVDLRQQEGAARREVAAVEKKAVASARREWQEMAALAKKLRPDLLSLERQADSWWKNIRSGTGLGWRAPFRSWRAPFSFKKKEFALAGIRRRPGKIFPSCFTSGNRT